MPLVPQYPNRRLTISLPDTRLLNGITAASPLDDAGSTGPEQDITGAIGPNLLAFGAYQ